MFDFITGVILGWAIAVIERALVARMERRRRERQLRRRYSNGRWPKASR